MNYNITMRNPEENQRLEEIYLRARQQYVPGKQPSRLRRWKRAGESLFSHFPDFWHLMRLPRKKDQCLIAVHVSGGMGDFLRFNAFLRALADKYPRVFFDVYGASPSVRFALGALPCVRTVAFERLFPWFSRRYDAVFYCGQITEPVFITHRAPIPELKRYAAQWETVRRTYRRFGALAFNQIAEDAAGKGLNFQEVLGRTAGFEGASSAVPLVDLQGTPNKLKGRRYITFNTGWNKHDVLPPDVKIHVKCWPAPLWEKFIALFKEKFPDIEPVQLGESNSPQIAGANTSLVGRTSLLEATAVLQGALLHIDCDCGFTHLAHALGVPCVVLFGPSNGRYLNYPENTAVLSPRCGGCWHMTEMWSNYCPLYKEAACMRSITAQMVLEAVTAQLARKHGLN